MLWNKVTQSAATPKTVKFTFKSYGYIRLSTGEYPNLGTKYIFDSYNKQVEIPYPIPNLYAYGTGDPEYSGEDLEVRNPNNSIILSEYVSNGVSGNVPIDFSSVNTEIAKGVTEFTLWWL